MTDGLLQPVDILPSRTDFRMVLVDRHPSVVRALVVNNHGWIRGVLVAAL